MPNPVKKSSVKLENYIEDMSSEITGVLQMDEFVWIENGSSEIPACELLDSSREPDADAENIAQHGTNTESSETGKECPLEYNVEDTEKPAEWEKQVLIDQQFWEQNGLLTQRENNSRTKHHAPQRLTIRQINNIENLKTTVKDPSYFKFDISTTATLKTLTDTRYLGPMHNVVSKGGSSVVIHASSPENSAVRVYFSGGNAVKIYKLTNDVKKNVVILKRAQREYEHLRLLPLHWSCVVRRMKNVLIFGFIGENQETAPSITKLSPEHFNKAYEIIIHDMHEWYNKYNIVHGNLCSKNILFVKAPRHVWHSSSYYQIPFYQHVIGWGHSVKRDHPRALMKLMRDCHFVTNFFKKRAVPVTSTEELFKDITGLQKISNKVLGVIQKKDLWQDGHLDNPNR